MNFNHFDAPTGGGIAFEAGINEGVKLTKFGIEQVNTPNFEGTVFDVIYSKGDSNLRSRFFAPDSAKPFANESQDQAEARVAADINNALISIVAAFHPSPYQQAFNDIVNKAKAKFATQEASFTDVVGFFEALLKQINPNYNQVEGKLLCYYDNRGYLTPPKALWENKGNVFFTIKDNITIAQRLKDKMTKVESTPTVSNDFDAF